jgi:hypothetical protein
MFSYNEFDRAFEKARNNHPMISRALGETVLKKFEERWENERYKEPFMREGFAPLMRLTLNELNVSGKAIRQMYAALIGFYYNPHAAYAKKRKSACATRPINKPVLAKVFQTRVEATGQVAWQL